jgi:hypothetical protein
MAYAIDIISESFNKTKSLFLPVRPGYWIRMGFISMFSMSNYGGSGSTGGTGGGREQLPGFSFSQAVTQFNVSALEFLARYGLFIGIAMIFFYLISLVFTFISSVFSFMFIEGVAKKEIRIKRSFVKNVHSGLSLFYFRFVLGIVSLIVLSLIFAPLLYSFFTNNLVNFNLWLLIPIIISLILYVFLVSIVLFLVYDFVLPIMYFRKLSFGKAWRRFVKFGKLNKLEIFVYWIIKLVLSIGAGVISLLLLIPVFIGIVILGLIGLMLFFVFQLLAGQTAAIIIVAPYALISLAFLVVMTATIFVPIPAFFRIYSIEMVKKLDTT